MMLRMRNDLRKTPEEGSYDISEEMGRDLQWWLTFLPIYDNVSYMWMDQNCKPDKLLATDACLEAMGAIFGDTCIHKKFPKWLLGTDKYFIHHLELVALVVSLKHWKLKLEGKRFTVLCDNMIVVDTLNGQFSKDVLLQHWMRECAYVCATGKFEILVQYINTKENTGPDLLSRKHKLKDFEQKFKQQVPGRVQFEELDERLFYSHSLW